MVDLITSALQSAALHRSATPSATKVDTPSVLDLGSDSLTKHTQNTGLIFNPSVGLFTSNEAFVTVAEAASSATFSSGSGQAGDRLNSLLSTNSTSKTEASGESVVAQETTKLQAESATKETEIETITDTANAPVFDSTVSNITQLEPSSSPGNSGESNGQGNNGNGGIG